MGAWAIVSTVVTVAQLALKRTDKVPTEATWVEQ